MSGIAEAVVSIRLIFDTMKKAYDAASDIIELPEAFREVVQRLPLVQNTFISINMDV